MLSTLSVPSLIVHVVSITIGDNIDSIDSSAFSRNYPQEVSMLSVIATYAIACINAITDDFDIIGALTTSLGSIAIDTIPNC